jgi:hypothetical protein
MATSYNWVFEALETLPHSGGQENVVYIVHWRLYGNRDTVSGSYTTDLFGAQQVAPYVAGSPFVPFENLTENEVTGWVLDAMGPKYGELTASLNQRIDDMITPPTFVLPPPWTTPTPSPTETYPPEPSYPVPPAPTPTPV